LKEEFFDFIGAVSRISLRDLDNQQYIAHAINTSFSPLYQTYTLREVKSICQEHCRKPRNHWKSLVKFKCCPAGIIPSRVVEEEFSPNCNRLRASIYHTPDIAGLMMLYKKHTLRIDKKLLADVASLERKIKALYESLCSDTTKGF